MIQEALYSSLTPEALPKSCEYRLMSVFVRHYGVVAQSLSSVALNMMSPLLPIPVDASAFCSWSDVVQLSVSPVPLPSNNSCSGTEIGNHLRV